MSINSSHFLAHFETVTLHLKDVPVRPEHSVQCFSDQKALEAEMKVLRTMGYTLKRDEGDAAFLQNGIFRVAITCRDGEEEIDVLAVQTEEGYINVCATLQASKKFRILGMYVADTVLRYSNLQLVPDKFEFRVLWRRDPIFEGVFS